MNYPSFNGRTRKGEFQVIPEKGGVYRQVWAAPLAANPSNIESNTCLFNTAIAATKTYIVDMVTDDTQEPPV